MTGNLALSLLYSVGAVILWVWGSSLAARYLVPNRSLPATVDRIGRMVPPNSILNRWGALVTLGVTALGPISLAVRLRQAIQTGVPLSLDEVVLAFGLLITLAWAVVLAFLLLRRSTT